MTDGAKVVALTTKVDDERGDVVRELEKAVEIARLAPGRTVACAIAIITVDAEGLHHVHTNTAGENRHTLAMMGAIQVLASSVTECLVSCPAFEPEPTPAPEDGGDA
jgi:hypothetical protein